MSKREKVIEKTDGQGIIRRFLLRLPHHHRGDERMREKRWDGTKHTGPNYAKKMGNRRAAAKRAQQARLVAQHKRQAKRRKARKANKG